MPAVDASIPLNYRGMPQPEGLDLLKTLGGIAQIKESRAKQAVYQGQAQTLQEELGERKRLGDFAKMYSQQPTPATTSPIESPVPASPASSHDEIVSTALPVPPAKPIVDVAQAPQAGAPAQEQPMANVGMRDAQSQPQLQPAPSMSRQGNQQPVAQGPPLMTEQQLTTMMQARENMIKQMVLQNPTHGPAMAEQLRAVDMHAMNLHSKGLENQKAQLELGKAGLQAFNELMGSVKDQPSLNEARRVAGQLNMPGAAQMPATWDQQGQAWVEQHRTLAQTQQQRAEQQLRQVDQGIQSFNSATARMSEQREARRGAPIMTSQGLAFQQATPAPGTTGTTMLTGPGNQPLLPTQAGEHTTFMTPSGDLVMSPNFVPPGQPIKARRIEKPPVATPPGYNTPPVGAQAQASPQGASGQNDALMTPEMAGRERAPALEARKSQIERASASGDAAVRIHQVADQMKALMLEGYYDTSKVVPKDLALAIKLYQDGSMGELKAKGLMGFADEKKMQNTIALKRLAGQLVNELQGGHGIRVGPTELDVLKSAAGNLEGSQPKASSLQTIDSLRSTANSYLERAKQIGKEEHMDAPELERRFPIKKQVQMPQFQRLYEQAKAQDPTLTREQLMLRYEKAGYHVMGTP